MSSASFSSSSSGSWSGDLGRAIKPVDCEQSFNVCKRSVSHTRSGALEDTERSDKLHERINSERLGRHLDNAVVSANIEHLAAKLMGEVGDGLQVLILVSEGLTRSQSAGVEVLSQGLSVCLAIGLGFLRREPTALELGLGVGHFPVVCQKLFKVLGAENADLGQQELALHKRGGGVVEDGPDRDQVLELSASLLNDAILSSQDNGHAREVLDLGVAHDKAVNVEASRGQDTRYTSEDTGLVLDQAVENMALWWSLRRKGSLVEDARDCCCRGDGRGGWGSGQWVDATVQGLVGDS